MEKRSERREVIFSPLATMDLSYFSSGIIITVTDNPAGRPHVTIERVQ